MTPTPTKTTPPPTEPAAAATPHAITETPAGPLPLRGTTPDGQPEADLRAYLKNAALEPNSGDVAAAMISFLPDGKIHAWEDQCRSPERASDDHDFAGGPVLKETPLTPPPSRAIARILRVTACRLCAAERIDLWSIDLVDRTRRIFTVGFTRSADNIRPAVEAAPPPPEQEREA